MRAAIGACCASSLLIAKCGGVALKACRDAAWRGKQKQGEESPRGHVIEARHTRNQDKPRASSSRDPIWPGFLHHPGHSWVLNENTSVAKLLIHARCVRRVTETDLSRFSISLSCKTRIYDEWNLAINFTRLRIVEWRVTDGLMWCNFLWFQASIFSSSQKSKNYLKFWSSGSIKKKYTQNHKESIGTPSRSILFDFCSKSRKILLHIIEILNISSKVNEN